MLSSQELAVVSFLTYPAHIRDTFYICTGGEEAPLARQHGEHGVWVLIEDAEGIDGVGDDVAAEGVEGFGAVELDGAC